MTAAFAKPKPIALTRLFDREVPRDVEAEVAVLGSLILDPTRYAEVAEIIGEQDFHSPAHRSIFAAIRDMAGEGVDFDAVTLNGRLRDREQLESIGGTDYIVQLAESVPTATSAHFYAGRVREKSMARAMIDRCGQAMAAAYTTDAKAVDMIDSLQVELFKIATRADAGKEAGTLGDALDALYAKLESDEGMGGISTGLMDLDELLRGGLHAGEMIVVAARPNVGKTTLALGFAQEAAMTGKPALMFSLEMGREELGMRMLCARTQIDSGRVLRRMLGDHEVARLREQQGVLSSLPFVIDDTPGLTLNGLRNRARRQRLAGKADLIIIDYLQLMNADPGRRRDANRQEDVGDISRGIKALARELNVPIVCLSQLNRQSEQRDGGRPRLSDLRESGAIEQDADVVILVHREDVFRRGEPNYQPSNEGELIVAKQRQGAAGTVKVNWEPIGASFRNAAYGGAQ